MTEYGDEGHILEMVELESRDQDQDQDDEIAGEEPPDDEITDDAIADDEIQNDINNGYAIIDEKRVMFSERCLIDGKLYMTIPSDFMLMPPVLAKVKYPSANRPDIIYSDHEGAMSINITLTKGRLENEGVEEAKSAMIEAITRLDPSREIVFDEIIEGEARIGYFDFVSGGLDGEIYNLAFLFSLDGQFVVGTFNCIHLDMAKWLDVAEQMVRSIRVVKEENNRGGMTE